MMCGDRKISSTRWGATLSWSDEPTYQLYTGHRGVGKSTELRRLRRHLEERQYKVVYFEATDDLDDTDAQYTDILLLHPALSMTLKEEGESGSASELAAIALAVFERVGADRSRV
jgi:pantothenate kinase-related protein Tda10